MRSLTKTLKSLKRKNSIEDNIEENKLSLSEGLKKLFYSDKKINKPYFKLFSRHGVKWNIAKWYVEKTFLKKTQLHQAMQGKLEFPIEEIIAANERKKLKMGE